MKFLRLLRKFPVNNLIDHTDALEHARIFRAHAKITGKTVVFTNGCFDVLHAGHVEYLQWARAQGDALILGLNDDDSVRALKGPKRPLIPFEQRRAVLAALRAVDVVVGFRESTPIAQYRLEELPERIVVEAGGGRIVLAPHLDGLSTTDIIAKIRAGD
jgi:rfaE bifunctional protein nucleotidyltransferase chain/domain